MTLVLFILGIILIIVGFIFIFVGLTEGFFPFIGGMLMCIPYICTSDYKTPTKEDVLDGKAYYQETQVITGNDTIKTYDIVWKE